MRSAQEKLDDVESLAMTTTIAGGWMVLWFVPASIAHSQGLWFPISMTLAAIGAVPCAWAIADVHWRHLMKLRRDPNSHEEDVSAGHPPASPTE